MDKIHSDYIQNGKYQMTRAEQRNIMLIGRTRTGKSTIKRILLDPTFVPDEFTLYSRRDPVVESFHICDNNIVLNIIDTPGLFEHDATGIDVRDNEKIQRTIEMCFNHEITKLHVCFVFAFPWYVVFINKILNHLNC
jgi:predicted GTPase